MQTKGTVAHYQGTELELFAEATNWKRYWSKSLAQYAVGTVIEVGAGIGSSSRYLCANARVDRCICLEPDPNFAAHLQNMVSTGILPEYCEIKCSILSALPSNVRVNAIFYIDVLNTSENDVQELALAATHLMPGGRW